MSFDVFAKVERPGATITVHNVQLIDVRPAEGGFVEMLTVEHAGTRRDLIGGGRWNEKHSRRDVGKFGYIRRVQPFYRDPMGGVLYFHSYIDQSLRRVPELDCIDRAAIDGGFNPEVVGWCCDAWPLGFLAPVDLIPGKAGRFMSDESEVVTLRVPPEFMRECQRVQMTPEALLRSFVGDLAGIQNLATCPRADGYGSNGSDEREYADAWLRRAHGMNAIDVDALEARADEALEKQLQRECFAALLDDFESCGGKSEDLFAAVQALVDKQADS